MKKRYILMFLLMFILFLITSFFIPYTGDDWGNYIENCSLKSAINIGVNNYFTWEGRFISRVLICLLVPRKILWSILNALVMTLIYYLIVKIVKPSNKKYLIMPILFICIVNIDGAMFTQTYLWITGNITYILCIPLILGYLYYMDKIFDSEMKHKIVPYIIFGVLNFVSTMFVENIAVALVVTNILYLIVNLIKYKKIDKMALICLILSSIGTLIMLESPGSKYRATLDAEFYNLSLLNKLKINIPNFIYFTFVINPYIIIAMLLIVDKAVERICYKVNKVFVNIALIIGVVILNVFTIINILYHLKDLIPLSLFRLSIYNKILDMIVIPNSIVFIVNYSVLILSFTAILIYRTITKKDYRIIFYYLVSIASTLCLLVVGTWGGRLATLSMFLMYIVIFKLLEESNIKLKIDDLKIKKALVVLLFLAVILDILGMIYLYYNVYEHSFIREKRMEKAIKNKEKNIEIYTYPQELLWNPEPWSSYHDETFKIYYKIDMDKNLVFNFRLGR